MKVFRTIVTAMLVSGCAQPAPPMIMSKKSPVELRAMQARIYETADRTKTVRSVIATLQDLGYNIDKVDAGSGTVSATKLADLRMSAAVSPRGTRMAVRANAVVQGQSGLAQVDAPEFYQQLFFAPLSTMMFIEAQADTDASAPEPSAPLPQTPTAPSAKPIS